MKTKTQLQEEAEVILTRASRNSSMLQTLLKQEKENPSHIDASHRRQRIRGILNSLNEDVRAYCAFKYVMDEKK